MFRIEWRLTHPTTNKQQYKKIHWLKSQAQLHRIWWSEVTVFAPFHANYNNDEDASKESFSFYCSWRAVITCSIHRIQSGERSTEFAKTKQKKTNRNNLNPAQVRRFFRLSLVISQYWKFQLWADKKFRVRLCGLINAHVFICVFANVKLFQRLQQFNEKGTNARRELFPVILLQRNANTGNLLVQLKFMLFITTPLTLLYVCAQSNWVRNIRKAIEKGNILRRKIGNCEHRNVGDIRNEFRTAKSNAIDIGQSNIGSCRTGTFAPWSGQHQQWQRGR